MKYSINFDSTDLPPATRAALIKQAGFDSVFVWWSRTDGGNLDRVTTARNAGLEIETAHTDFYGINNMWLDNSEGDDHFNYYIKTINEARELDIPTLIVHLSSGNTPPEINDLGISRFLRMMEHAEALGVTLAFENLRKVEYLDALLSATSSSAARFCFDIGHENIYNGGSGILEKHGARLAAFHIHDNHGDSDEHLLPFDGSIDWSAASKRIAPYLDRLPLTIEAYASDRNTLRYNPEDFYALAMERAVKLTEK